MSPNDPAHPGSSTVEAALLSEKEALQRLDLLVTVSTYLDAALDDYDGALQHVAEACVAEFADLCVIEVIGGDGTVRVAASQHVRGSGLETPRPWSPVGRVVARDRKAVLVYPGADGHADARRLRERIGAQSMIVSPMASGGFTLGWLVLATSPRRRGFRPSALKVAADLSSRIATAIQRVVLHREMQAAAREQSRTVRRLRRLAAAATNLAGAATPQAVLDTACVEACIIHEANGAVARWAKEDGSTVTARAGDIDERVAERAFGTVRAGRVMRGRGWIAYPLPITDPWQHGALVVFMDDALAGEEEPVLSSLASLIPVAFERALGTETALKHETRLRAVVEASPVALVEVNPDGQVTMANRTAQDLFGWGADSAGWDLGGELAGHLVDMAGQVLASGAVISRTVKVDDRELSVSCALLPPVHTAETASVLVAGVDLSEVRRAERALVRAQRLDAMGQVAGRVAHDFNNLLTLIVGYAAILGRGLIDERQVAMVSNIEDAAKRAATLTQQMLDMTRQNVDSGVVIDLGSAVEQLDPVLARVAGPQVDLRIRTSRNVIKVRLDPSEMEQIVLNLVINACDAMGSRKGGRVDVGVQVVVPPPEDVRALDLPSGPLAMLTVADDGPGMTTEVLNRCLEPFFTTKERGRGSGLGLPTVYGLVRERGGQLHIDSGPEKGTHIRIWLPLVRDAAVSPGADHDEHWPPGRALTGRILLVEDEDDLRAMAAETLSSVGLDVTVCASAEEAAEAFGAGGDFDVLVTDVILPGMSGIELVSALRRIKPSLPAVYMTGYTGTRDIPAGGADPVIRKPYAPDTLRLRVAEMVNLARVRARLTR